MVFVNRAPDSTATVPTVEQCTMMARIYDEGRGCYGDIRRMCKDGWKVVSVQEQRLPLPIERLRANCPGTLTRASTQGLVVFYRRCGHPSENRVKRIVMRFRGEQQHHA